MSKTGIANKQHTRKHISPNISIRTCTRAQACASLSQYSLSRPHSHMRTEEHVLSFPSLLLAFFQIQFLTSLSVMMNSGFYSQNGSAVFGFSSVRSFYFTILLHLQAPGAVRAIPTALQNCPRVAANGVCEYLCVSLPELVYVLYFGTCVLTFTPMMAKHL